MREVLGLVALDGVLLGVGLAWAYGLGLVRRRADALRLLGLAFLLGWAATGVGVTFLLEAGLAVTVWQALLLAAVMVAAGLFLSNVGLQQTVATSEWRRWERAVGWIFAAGVVVFVGHALRRAWVQGGTETWDAWAFWLPRAESLVRFDGIDLSAGGFALFAHPYYPPLVPGMDAVAFRFMGTTDAAQLPLQDWLLYASFLAAVAGLLARRISPAVLWPALLAAAAMPSLTNLVGSALADLPLALLFALAGLSAALWLDEGGTAHLAAAAVLLAAAAVTKSDGFPLALLLVAVLTLAALVARRPRWWLATALAVPPLFSAVPWKLWIGAHELPPPGDYRARDLLDPGHLAARTDRLDPIVDQLPGYLLDPDRWLLAVPLMVAAALVAARATSVLALGVVAVGMLGLTFLYWGGSVEIDFWLESSAGRTVSSLTVFAAAIVPLLLGEALRDRR